MIVQHTQEAGEMSMKELWRGHIGEHMNLNYIAEYVPNVKRHSRFQLIFSTGRR